MKELTEKEMQSLVGTIVQFTENHKWRGSLGFVREVKKCGDDYRFMIGCTMPDNKAGCNTAYIFSMASENDFEPLIDGCAILMPPEDEDE